MVKERENARPQSRPPTSNARGIVKTIEDRNVTEDKTRKSQLTIVDVVGRSAWRVDFCLACAKALYFLRTLGVWLDRFVLVQ